MNFSEFFNPKDMMVRKNMINEKVAPIGESEMKFTELMFAFVIGVNMLFTMVGVVIIALGDLNIGIIVLGIGFINFTITTTANYILHKKSQNHSTQIVCDL